MNLYNAILENKHFHDLNPLVFGGETCSPGYSFGYNIRDFWLVHYIVSGKGYYENNGKTYEVNTGNIFIIRPNEVTKYYTGQENNWTYIWIGFDGALAENFSSLPLVVDLKSNIFKEMLSVEGLINSKEEFLAGKLFLLYSELFCDKVSSKYTEAVKNFIYNNYMSNTSVETIANSLNLNRRYLSRIFKQDTGVTIQEYILETRFCKAFELLSNGYSVKDAAYMVGYSDPFVFSKLFKKHTGRTPASVKVKSKY